MNGRFWALTIMAVLLPLASFGGEADVIEALAHKQADGVYTFRVTVKHADEGWDHYADKWEVLTPEGELLGTRTLMHPHVGEQPFTRSLQGVKVPSDVNLVILRAHDSVHGLGGETVEVELGN